MEIAGAGADVPQARADLPVSGPTSNFHIKIFQTGLFVDMLTTTIPTGRGLSKGVWGPPGGIKWALTLCPLIAKSGHKEIRGRPRLGAAFGLVSLILRAMAGGEGAEGIPFQRRCNVGMIAVNLNVIWEMSVYDGEKFVTVSRAHLGDAWGLRLT